MGRHILECHKESSREKVDRAAQYLANHRDKSYHRMVVDEENHKVYENTYTAIFNNQNQMAGMAVITKDITAQRKAEEEKANFPRSQAIAIESLREQYYHLQTSAMEMLANLIESKDKYTDGHSKRVTKIASKMYEHHYGITEEYLDIQWAAKLHNIGKICIPDQIINKQGKLTKEEFDEVKKHSTIAGDILKKLDHGKRVSAAVRHHHERFDGKGYPDGLAGTAIPAGARIIAIADTFDVMNSRRPYRKALSFERCLDEIQENAGTQFDPGWVETFLKLAKTGSIE